MGKRVDNLVKLLRKGGDKTLEILCLHDVIEVYPLGQLEARILKQRLEQLVIYLLVHAVDAVASDAVAPVQPDLPPEIWI